MLEIFGRDILKHQIKKNRKKEGGRSKRKESGNKNMLYIHPIYRRIWLVTETQIPSLLGSNLCKLSFHAGLTPDDDFKGARFSPQMFKVKLKRKKPSQDSPTCFWCRTCCTGWFGLSCPDPLICIVQEKDFWNAFCGVEVFCGADDYATWYKLLYKLTCNHQILYKGNIAKMCGIMPYLQHRIDSQRYVWCALYALFKCRQFYR